MTMIRELVQKVWSDSPVFTHAKITGDKFEKFNGYSTIVEIGRRYLRYDASHTTRAGNNITMWKIYLFK